MMPARDKQQCDDQLVIRYLLAAASAEETERLDELSVADDEFARRLRAIENDLVDAYVQGELPQETRERFESVYLSSPKRREKVRFAESLNVLAGDGSRAPEVAPAHPLSALRWLLAGVHRPLLGWALAGAACLLLLGSGYLVYDNLRLRNRAGEAQTELAALAQRQGELQHELEEQRRAARERQGNSPPTSAVTTLAVLLLPQTRGTGNIATIAIPPGTDRVTFRLKLETDEFTVYQARLRDPANQIVWRSDSVKARPEDETKVVAVTLAAALLRQQNYMLELAGNGGAAELVSSYAFRVSSR